VTDTIVLNRVASAGIYPKSKTGVLRLVSDQAVETDLTLNLAATEALIGHLFGVQTALVKIEKGFDIRGTIPINPENISARLDREGRRLGLIVHMKGQDLSLVLTPQMARKLHAALSMFALETKAPARPDDTA
jgi:hypothetical protein